jgi:hypothetical protein
MKYISLLSLLITGLSGCNVPNDYATKNAYVVSEAGQDQACYKVAIGFTKVSDEKISRCLTLDEAKTIADSINRSMDGKWNKQ